MALLEGMRKRVHNYYLKQELNGSGPERSIITLADAKHIGILYDATLPENNVVITKFAERLKKMEKKVTVLGYVDDKKTESHYGTLLFNNKSLNWYRKPSGDVVKEFVNKPLDILINAFVGENLPLEYIATTCRAKFRVGEFHEGKTHCSELLVNTGNKMDLEYLLKQIAHFLNIIHTHD